MAEDGKESVLAKVQKIGAEYKVSGGTSWTFMGKEAQASIETLSYFIEHHCEVDPGGRQELGAFRDAYRKWVRASEGYVCSAKRLSQHLNALGIVMIKSGSRYIVGLRLKDVAPVDPFAI